MVDFDPYTDVADTICNTNDLSNFKNNPSYNYVLEHVTPYEGYQYLLYIVNEMRLPLFLIKQFCETNDSLGNPKKTKYGFLEASPTSLRYIFHAHLILTHLQSLHLPSIDIVEIGGGYGGLCFAIHAFSQRYNLTIQSYTCVDLPSIRKLQSIYLSRIMPGKTIDCIDSTTYGATIDKTNMFLISNYAFSEISMEHQTKYREILFPKVAHGFMTWNCIPVYNFGFEYKDVKEYPVTHERNRYISF